MDEKDILMDYDPLFESSDLQDTKPRNQYEIFLNCDNFKKLTGDLVSGKIEFDFKDFCNQYYHLFNNKFLEKYESDNRTITSISFEKPSTLNIEYHAVDGNIYNTLSSVAAAIASASATSSINNGYNGKYKITNLQEISEILSEMAKKFEEFAERYKEISNSLDEFDL